MTIVSGQDTELRTWQLVNGQAMLTEAYISALLANEALADQVWQLWDDGKIDDDVAFVAWWIVASTFRKAAFPDSGRSDRLKSAENRVR